MSFLRSPMGHSMVLDLYNKKRGPYYKKALIEFNTRGGFVGVIRILGIIAELEDILKIYKKQLDKTRKELDNVRNQRTH